MLVAGDGTAVGECGGGDTGWEVYTGECGGGDTGWEVYAVCSWGVNIPVMSSIDRLPLDL